MLNIKELRDKNKNELHKILAEQRELLRKLRFQKKQGQLNDYSNISKVKKTIARILTLLNENK